MASIERFVNNGAPRKSNRLRLRRMEVDEDLNNHIQDVVPRGEQQVTAEDLYKFMQDMQKYRNEHYYVDIIANVSSRLFIDSSKSTNSSFL
jgi:hypothetical protein